MNYVDYHKSNNEYILVRVFRNKGIDDKNLLHQIKCLEFLIDNLSSQRKIYEGSEK